jgi:hypothetical protein
MASDGRESTSISSVHFGDDTPYLVLQLDDLDPFDPGVEGTEDTLSRSWVSGRII